MEKVFTTSSAYLGIWNTLPETFRKAFNLKLKEELKLIKNISIEVETEEFYPIDDPKVQSFTAIVDKIISRGHPTYINKFYEDRVIKILEKNGFVFEDLKITTNGRNIGYRIKSLPPNFNHENELKIIHRLIFSKFNNSLTNHQITQSVNEEDAPIVGPSEDKFFEILGDSISHKLQSNILRQPLISDLIGQEIDPIINSKVDFALNFGDLKLVIEIDGGEHEFDEAVREHDEERKAILESNGWDLWRPKNEEIQKGASEWIKKIKNIEQDSIINEENELFLQKEMDSIAWLSLVHPHLVQRATKAINLIINHGKFPQGKNAKILIVEEDIPVIIEALYELYEIHENLKILSDDICDLPFLEIEYIGAGVRIKPPKSKYLSWKKVVKPQKKYDLILDHSFTLRSGQIGLMEEKLKLTTLNNFVRLRSDPTVSEDRKMLWANTINYNLQDLEKAILSLKTDDPLKIPKNKYGALRYFLKSIFRKDDYWDGQVMVISRLLLKKNTIVLLPTGGGKSLTYQIAGLLQPGVTIIIDPLVALISDQVENLNMMGFDRAGFISSLLE
ncbi:MAG: DUF559 domain-containing protein, partial [Candidatus Marinimicrobia bacterium]|nr:DUF559 domain-containing protein [Candidatus Neomarinimicrobiota bacterium]